MSARRITPTSHDSYNTIHSPAASAAATRSLTHSHPRLAHPRPLQQQHDMAEVCITTDRQTYGRTPCVGCVVS